MDQSRGPFFLVGNEGNGDDVTVAWYVGEAEGEMEPPEVESGYYTVYDREGRTANLVTTRIDVTISGWSSTTQAARLREILTSCLQERAISFDESPDDVEFALQVARALAEVQERHVFPRVPFRFRRPH